jgi:hypothetical protein
MTEYEELIKRPLDEVFDTMMEVQRNPYGAWMAIQEQANCIDALVKERKAMAMRDAGYDVYAALEAKLAKAVDALQFYAYGHTIPPTWVCAHKTLLELEDKP